MKRKVKRNYDAKKKELGNFVKSEGFEAPKGLFRAEGEKGGYGNRPRGRAVGGCPPYTLAGVRGPKAPGKFWGFPISVNRKYL